MKSDLKTALKSKDKERLNVLRALIAETINASKTSKPIQTDIQLLSLLRKRMSSAKEAAEQFRSANRQDLYDKEMGQIKVFDEYASAVQTLDESEVLNIVKQTFDKLSAGGQQPAENSLLKELFAASGPLAGKPVERNTAVEQVKKFLKS